MQRRNKIGTKKINELKKDLIHLICMKEQKDAISIYSFLMFLWKLRIKCLRKLKNLGVLVFQPIKLPQAIRNISGTFQGDKVVHSNSKRRFINNVSFNDVYIRAGRFLSLSKDLMRKTLLQTTGRYPYRKSSLRQSAQIPVGHMLIGQKLGPTHSQYPHQQNRHPWGFPDQFCLKPIVSLSGHDCKCTWVLIKIQKTRDHIYIPNTRLMWLSIEGYYD